MSAFRFKILITHLVSSIFSYKVLRCSQEKPFIMQLGCNMLHFFDFLISIFIEVSGSVSEQYTDHSSPGSHFNLRFIPCQT